MSEVAIQVENLGKQYRIGALRDRSDSLREVLAGFFSYPADKLRRRSRNSQGDNSQTTIWALKDVSLEIKQGEVVGIIGRNGAGKSTLLKILSRITEPTTGRAVIHGRVGSLLEVGTGFHPELTGRENIYLNGAILGMRRAEIDARFDEIVAFSELERFLDTPVKRYSSGMYVRLGFAVAAHLAPEILLVDEVLAVGDAAFQKKCLGKMGDIGKEGRTVLFVSHNMLAVQTLCSKAYWIDSGKVAAFGPVSEVVPAYLRSGSPDTSQAERVWDDLDTAPGNETLRVRRISVVPETGSHSEPITMESPIRIELEYWNLLPREHLHATLHLRDERGIIAFTASTGFNPDPYLHLEPPFGLIRSICHIPGNLLNSGMYYVDLLLVRDRFENNYRIDDIITFEVIDSRPRKFFWFGREPGVVQPALTWESYLIDK